MEVAALLVLVGALVLGWFLYKRRSGTISTLKQATVRLNGPGTYEFTVLGVSRYRSELEAIYGETPHHETGKQVDAALIPDGKDSVRVSVEGKTVGHLAPDLARAYRRRLVEAGHLQASGVCKARITARPGVDYTDFAVRLDLPVKQSEQKASPS